MQQKLFLSTAILFGMQTAPAAYAQEWDLAVHGFFDQFVGYAHNDVDAGSNPVLYDDFDPNGSYKEGVSFTNAEIHFTPSVKLDNGTSFGINVQLEGDNAPAGTTMDESYMIIQNPQYGKLVLGNTNSGAYWSSVIAPNVVSMPLNSGSVSAFVPFSAVYSGKFNASGLATTAEVNGNNDPARVTYYSPSFNGFMMTFSYAPRATTTEYCNNDNYCIDNRGDWNNYVFDRKKTLNDVVDFGLRYTQTFGEWNVDVSARYGTANWGKNIRNTDPNAPNVTHKPKNPYVYGFGGRLGYGPFTIGGSYSRNYDGNKQTHQGNSTGWGAGMSYTPQGPWSFSATTFQGKSDSGPATGHFRAYEVGANRAIAPGVSFDLFALYVRARNGYKKSTDQNARVKGWGLGTAVNLTF